MHCGFGTVILSCTRYVGEEFGDLHNLLVKQVKRRVMHVMDCTIITIIIRYMTVENIHEYNS